MGEQGAESIRAAVNAVSQVQHPMFTLIILLLLCRSKEQAMQDTPHAILWELNITIITLYNSCHEWLVSKNFKTSTNFLQ